MVMAASTQPCSPDEIAMLDSSMLTNLKRSMWMMFVLDVGLKWFILRLSSSVMIQWTLMAMALSLTLVWTYGLSVLMSLMVLRWHDNDYTTLGTHGLQWITSFLEDCFDRSISEIIGRPWTISPMMPRGHTLSIAIDLCAQTRLLSVLACKLVVLASIAWIRL